MELYDGSTDYTLFGLADIWKGSYHGEPVCIKALRRMSPISLLGIKNIGGYVFYQKRIKHALDKTPRRMRKSISHPNVLPVIDVSETLSPFCIVSPWMPDGNITQYTQMNPGANRLMLVRADRLEAR
jgi:serine/threonine protein kinase